MEKVALAKLLLVLLGSTLLAFSLLLWKRYAGKDNGPFQPISRMSALLQSIALVTLSALAANRIIRPVDVEGLKRSTQDSADLLIRHAKIMHLLGFVGLTVLFCLVIGAIIVGLFGRERPVYRWLHAANVRQKQVSFGKEDSQAIKGIAIIVLLCYHLFYTGRPDGYPISFFPFTEIGITQFMGTFKICVSLFAFISGYGLFTSYRNKQISDCKWVCRRYIKTFSGYWFIYVLSVLILQMLYGRFVSAYYKGNLLLCALNVVIDFLGLANLINSYTFMGTWWYMSAAFVFILLTPLFCRDGGKYLPLWLIGSIIFPRLITGGHGAEFFVEYLGGTTPFVFLAAFLSGAVLARNDCLIRIVNGPGRSVRFAVECVLLIIAYHLYQSAPLKTYWELKWALIPVLLVLFCVEYVIRIPGLKQILRFLGRHSMNVYLIHNFFRKYLHDFIYGQKHFLLILLLLMGISLICSILIEALKKLLRYDESIHRLPDWLENKLLG